MFTVPHAHLVQSFTHTQDWDTHSSREEKVGVYYCTTFLIEKMIVDYFEGYGSSKCVLTTVHTT